jgi:hypothetical protein
MIKEPLIIDNVVPRSYQDLIEQTFLESPDFPWAYSPNVTEDNNSKFNNTEDTFGMSHSFLNRGMPGQFPATTQFLKPLIYQACEKANIKFNTLYFGRVFLTFPKLNNFRHNLWHVDMPRQPHISAIYYVNDSTGPTIISKLTEYDCSLNDMKNKDSVEILETVEPKKGRMVFFNGSHWHASTNPKDNHRCIINFNLG